MCCLFNREQSDPMSFALYPRAIFGAKLQSEIPDSIIHSNDKIHFKHVLKRSRTNYGLYATFIKSRFLQFAAHLIVMYMCSVGRVSHELRAPKAPA